MNPLFSYFLYFAGTSARAGLPAANRKLGALCRIHAGVDRGGVINIPTPKMGNRLTAFPAVKAIYDAIAEKKLTKVNPRNIPMGVVGGGIFGHNALGEDIVFPEIAKNGAKIAVKYVTSYPGKVSKLVLFAFNPAPISMRPGFDRKKFETEHQKALKSPSWRIRKFWKDLISDPKLLSLREWAIEITKNTPPEIFVNSLYNFQMEDVRPLLERIDVPTLLLYGDLPISGLKGVKRLKERIPSSETFIFRGGGQCFVNMVKANQFNKIVENFIEEEQ